MFSGSHIVTVDAKGRVAVPSKLKEHFVNANGLQVVAAKAVEASCIWLYTIDSWQQVMAKLSEAPNLNPEVLTFQRQFVANAFTLEGDSAGRILLPAILRAHARITKKVVFAGLINKIELWNEHDWQEQQQKSIKPFTIKDLKEVAL